MLMNAQRPDQDETSLALVPRHHALIPPPNLEAEASGLLDRLLGVFQEAARQASISILFGAHDLCPAETASSSTRRSTVSAC